MEVSCWGPIAAMPGPEDAAVAEKSTSSYQHGRPPKSVDASSLARLSSLWFSVSHQRCETGDGCDGKGSLMVARGVRKKGNGKEGSVARAQGAFDLPRCQPVQLRPPAR